MGPKKGKKKNHRVMREKKQKRERKHRENQARSGGLGTWYGKKTSGHDFVYTILRRRRKSNPSTEKLMGECGGRLTN